MTCYVPSREEILLFTTVLHCPQQITCKHTIVVRAEPDKVVRVSVEGRWWSHQWRQEHGLGDITVEQLTQHFLVVLLFFRVVLRVIQHDR